MLLVPRSMAAMRTAARPPVLGNARRAVGAAALLIGQNGGESCTGIVKVVLRRPVGKRWETCQSSFRRVIVPRSRAIDRAMRDSTPNAAVELLSVLSASSQSSSARRADDLRAEAFAAVIDAMTPREESWHARERR